MTGKAGRDDGASPHVGSTRATRTGHRQLSDMRRNAAAAAISHRSKQRRYEWGKRILSGKADREAPIEKA